MLRFQVTSKAAPQLLLFTCTYIECWAIWVAAAGAAAETTGTGQCGVQRRHATSSASSCCSLTNNHSRRHTRIQNWYLQPKFFFKLILSTETLPNMYICFFFHGWLPYCGVSTVHCVTGSCLLENILRLVWRRTLGTLDAFTEPWTSAFHLFFLIHQARRGEARRPLGSVHAYSSCENVLKIQLIFFSEDL